MEQTPHSSEDRLRALSKALDGLERQNEPKDASPPPPREKIKFDVRSIFSSKLNWLFFVLWAGHVSLNIGSQGFPSGSSELTAVFVVPALAAFFLCLFYKAAMHRRS